MSAPREIVLDTETTGLSPTEGHRIIEVGCVELKDARPTDRTWHSYFNPQRSISRDASRVHGLTLPKLRKEPLFADRAANLLAFLGEDAKLIAHNANFDAGFLNAEFGRAGLPALNFSRFIDTLAIARLKRPGKKNSLDALCAYFGISTVHREKHGALKDAILLAEVYARLCDKMQTALDLGASAEQAQAEVRAAWRRPIILASRLTREEALEHAAFVATIPNAIWLQPQGGVADATTNSA